jgi:hypothetical protein
MSLTILDHFDSAEAFDEVLTEAEEREDLTGWEETFLGDIREQFNAYDADTYLTHVQAQKLLSIRDK